MTDWYTVVGVFMGAVLVAAALGSFWIEGLKRSLLRPYERRKKRNPDAFDRAIFYAWISGSFIACGASWWVTNDRALTVAGLVGGLGSRVFYDKVLEPSIRALGGKLAKRIAGHTVAPRPETRVGVAAVDDEHTS